MVLPSSEKRKHLQEKVSDYWRQWSEEYGYRSDEALAMDSQDLGDHSVWPADV